MARIPRRSASLILARVQTLAIDNEFGEGGDTHVLSFEGLLRALNGKADANAA